LEGPLPPTSTSSLEKPTTLVYEAKQRVYAEWQRLYFCLVTYQQQKLNLESLTLFPKAPCIFSNYGALRKDK
jgi:hypothetical protein